jgi:putative flippase GtrA
MSQVPFWKSLGRSQIASFSATTVDFAVFFLAMEGLGIWYVVSAALGALCGAIVNFTLNRNWSFEAEEGRWGPQAMRYATVSGGSLCLNVLGVYAATEGLGIPPAASKVAISLAVGLLFNFPLQRRYVFK